MACKGEGRVAPITIFRQHRANHLTECANCGGSGTIDNFVFVNPNVNEIDENKDKSNMDETHKGIDSYIEKTFEIMNMTARRKINDYIPSLEDAETAISEAKKVTSKKFKKENKNGVCD